MFINVGKFLKICLWPALNVEHEHETEAGIGENSEGSGMATLSTGTHTTLS